MKTEPPDMISAGPRTMSFRVVWVLAVVLLAAAMAGAIAVAVHYRAEAAARPRHAHPVGASLPPSTGPQALFSKTVTLPSYGTLDDALTVVSARFSGQLAQIVLFAHISGGRPHTEYTLIGFDCAGSAGFESWAAGVTDAHGSGTLSGHAWTVSRTDEYWLQLAPSSGLGGPGVNLGFTPAGRLSAVVPAGNPACAGR